MAPVVHGLEDKYGDKVNFVFLDIDEEATTGLQELMNYERRWRPFILFFTSDGQQFGGPLIGYQDGSIVEQSLIDLLVADGISP